MTGRTRSREGDRPGQTRPARPARPAPAQSVGCSHGAGNGKYFSRKSVTRRVRSSSETSGKLPSLRQKKSTFRFLSRSSSALSPDCIVVSTYRTGAFSCTMARPVSSA
ncbi:hypothetical protein Cus16_0357 [Curtobacterium sp. ER1/6]|nr:hypothetical protein Cus16_0357 [Curtobacterium sp. ER1/6]